MRFVSAATVPSLFAVAPPSRVLVPIPVAASIAPAEADAAAAVGDDGRFARSSYVDDEIVPPRQNDKGVVESRTVVGRPRIVQSGEPHGAVCGGDKPADARDSRGRGGTAVQRIFAGRSGRQVQSPCHVSISPCRCMK